jgi:hypothetical protein
MADCEFHMAASYVWSNATNLSPPSLRADPVQLQESKSVGQ